MHRAGKCACLTSQRWSRWRSRVDSRRGSKQCSWSSQRLGRMWRSARIWYKQDLESAEMRGSKESLLSKVRPRIWTLLDTWTVFLDQAGFLDQETGDVVCSGIMKCSFALDGAKIRTIKDINDSKVSSLIHPINILDLPFTGTPLDTFPSVTTAEVLKLINKSSNMSSSIDFIPTSLIKSCATVFSEIISNLANLSISQGSFPLKFKLAQVVPLLKKPGLDKNTPSNYRSISNLNNISKLLERFILSRIQYHKTSFCNFNPFQSTYQRYYSTEFALLLALDNI